MLRGQVDAEIIENYAAAIRETGDFYNFVRTLEAYTEAYGDDEHGTAAKVRAALFDLYRVTKSTWALPVPSYGLKVVEGYVGYRRKLSEANGAWAMAKFIEAVEREDESERAAQIGEILDYNEEDLDATWQIVKWLMMKEGREVPGGSRP